MRKRLVLLLAVMGLSLTPGTTAWARPAGSDSAPGTKTPVINKRQRHQQVRIYRGVRSGELTRGETFRLEREAAHIQRDKWRAKSDGVVTGRERAHLHHDLNRSSRHIYRAKHNGRTRRH